MVMTSALRTLEVFEKVAELQPVRLGELTSLLGLPKSTIQRTLETLAEAGWILPVGDDYTRWFIAPRIQELVDRTGAVAALRAAAHPVMAELSVETGGSVQLSIPTSRDQLLTVEFVQGSRTMMPIGSTLPRLFTAAGMVLMAEYDDEAIRAMYDDGVRQRAFARVGPQVSFESLMETIGAARRDGFVTRVQEEESSGFVAAAIEGPDEEAVGSLTIALPLAKFRGAKRQQWGALVRRAALRVGDDLAATTRPHSG